MRRTAAWVVAAAVAAGFVGEGRGLPAVAGEPSAARLSEAEALEIAIEGYHYFYSLVSMEVTRRVATNVEPGKVPAMGPMNQFAHMRAYPTADFRAVVRPNFDTLYSSAWLDLTQEPMVVSAPDTGGRYYLLPMLDMWSDVFASPGKRTSGTGAASWAVVPPGWAGTLPAGVQRIDAPTRHVWIVGRTQTNGPADYAAVHKVQDGYTITPLSRWGAPAVPPKVVIDPSVDMKTPPLEQVNAMKGQDYFRLAAELLQRNPPHLTDWSIIARLRRLGIEAGRPLDPAALDPVVRGALDRAATEGLAAMVAKVPTLARVVNGWQLNTDTMGVYGNHYLKRAIVAMVGLGANQPEDAVYPMLAADAEGKPLRGEQAYVLHFAKDELPPTGAFWSVTMYDVDGFQVANPLQRFAIGDRDALTFGPDGSLDLYIQHASPGKERESNWLPAPASGVLGVTMRIYAPKASALDGRWAPPAVRRAP